MEKLEITEQKTVDKHVRNNLYASYLIEELPWEYKEWHENNEKFIRKLIGKDDISWSRILDYWCGSWWNTDNLRAEWANVDLADISENLIGYLNKKYSYMNKMPKIYYAESPKDLSDKSYYDYIIASSVLHHIYPSQWTKFLEGFAELLKPGWKLLILWIAISDDQLQKNHNLWQATWRKMYPIDSLWEYIWDEYVVESEWFVDRLADNNAFNVWNRKFKYFVLVKK